METIIHIKRGKVNEKEYTVMCDQYRSLSNVAVEFVNWLNQNNFLVALIDQNSTTDTFKIIKLYSKYTTATKQNVLMFGNDDTFHVKEYSKLNYLIADFKQFWKASCEYHASKILYNRPV